MTPSLSEFDFAAVVEVGVEDAEFVMELLETELGLEKELLLVAVLLEGALEVDETMGAPAATIVLSRDTRAFVSVQQLS